MNKPKGRYHYGYSISQYCNNDSKIIQKFRFILCLPQHFLHVTIICVIDSHIFPLCTQAFMCYMLLGFLQRAHFNKHADINGSEMKGQELACVLKGPGYKKILKSHVKILNSSSSNLHGSTNHTPCARHLTL